MLGPDSPENIRKIVAETVEIFNDHIERDLSVLAAEVDEEIIRMLSEKMSVLMLADQVNDTPEVPYISVWQGGKADIYQVYLSPRVVDLLGYSAEEVKAINLPTLPVTGSSAVSRRRICPNAKPCRRKRLPKTAKGSSWATVYGRRFTGSSKRTAARSGSWTKPH